MTIINITADNILRFFANWRHFEHAEKAFNLNNQKRVARWSQIIGTLVKNGQLIEKASGYVTAKGATPVDVEHSEVQIHNPGLGNMFRGLRLGS